MEEHGAFKPEHLPYIASLNINFEETEYEGEPKFLGITPDFKASYYIGAEWLTAKKAVVVTPKLSDLDYVGMFMSALRIASSRNYFSKFYGINFSGQKIESKQLDNILSPLLLIHFLFSVKNLLEKGLKKGYVIQEENLQAKIKGKVLMSKHFGKNISNHRNDRIMCCYQIYSVDIPENRLIKKALLFAKRMLCILPSLQSHKMSSEINQMLSTAMAAFEGVSDDVNLSTVKCVSKNKLFGNYSSVIRLAKQLLKRYDYSIDSIGKQERMVPPFWIDMSRLYEVYVYGLLLETYPGQIRFQVKGNYKTAVDFLKMDEELIMDAKYKPQYKSANAGCIDDIRQISGYARDELILRELNIKDKNIEPKCLIIYPEMEDCCSISSFVKGNPLISVATPIKGFREFYKIRVPVPKLIRN